MKIASALLVIFSLAACQKKPAATEPAQAMWDEFSGEKALAHVQQLVDFGPRPPATEAIEKARTYITKQLEGFGWRVTRQEFKDQTPQGEVKFVNLVATFADSAQPSFLLCSHYDTKFFAEATFVGANDGGSSNGILLEIARVFAQRPELARKLELVFFDGEEAFVQFTTTDGLYGSRYFAKQLAEEGKAKQFRAGILFDMVGDSSLGITLPIDSPAEMASGIFAAAEALNFRKHFTYMTGSILDDHVPLFRAGITMIDLIDFEYPPWHTPEDTMDKLSAESLKIVGAVATRYLAETALK